MNHNNADERKMRSAHYDKHWFSMSSSDDVQGPITGLNLGYDHCAEHEFGIGVMAGMLGLTEEHGLGVERHRVRVTPDALVFSERKARRTSAGKTKTYTLATLQLGGPEKSAVVPDSVESWGRGREGSDIASAWDGRGFAVTVEGKENVERLKELHAAMLRGDATLSLSGSMNPFAGSGLCITIISRLPQTVVAEALQNDIDHRRLLQAAADTGIEQELQKAGCRYYALDPQWADEEQTQVRFFLNPMRQREFESGWYDLEELLAWARGEGPVIKANSRPSSRPRG